MGTPFLSRGCDEPFCVSAGTAGAVVCAGASTVPRTPPVGCAARLLKAPEARVSAMVEQKKTVAAMAVERERRHGCLP